MGSSISKVSEEGPHGGAIFNANIEWSSAECALPWEYQLVLGARGQGGGVCTQVRRGTHLAIYMGNMGPTAWTSLLAH